MKQSKDVQNRIISISDWIVFAVLFGIYLYGSFFLFYHQTGNFDGYWSDMGAYLMELKGEESGYDFPYPVMFLLARFFAHFSTPVLGMALSVTCLNGLTPLILKIIFYIKLSVKEKRWKSYIATLASFVLVTVSMIYPFTYIGRYNEIGDTFLYRQKGVFSPNPYHNATSLCCRPFTLITFVLFIDIFDKYEEKNKWFCVEYLLYSVFLLIATLTKPSFTIVMGMMALTLMIINVVKSKFKTFKQFVQFGICHIPTIIALLFQFSDVFVQKIPEAEKGIGIAPFKAWSVLSDNIPLSILLGLTFPIVVLLCHLKQLKSEREYLYSLIYTIFGLLTICLLYEKGWRMIHVNFQWGYIHGMFFMYSFALLVLLKDTFKKADNKINKLWLIPQYIVLIMHIVCGVDYLTIFLRGGLYS